MALRQAWVNSGIKTGLGSNHLSKHLQTQASVLSSPALCFLSSFYSFFSVLAATFQIWWALTGNAHTGLRVSCQEGAAVITVSLWSSGEGGRGRWHLPRLILWVTRARLSDLKDVTQSLAVIQTTTKAKWSGKLTNPPNHHHSNVVCVAVHNPQPYISFLEGESW